MLYLYGILVALQIVAGQALWKVGVEKAHFVISKDYLLSMDMIKFLFSPYVLGGIAVYGMATLFYMSLLSKYQYTHLQSVVVSTSLVATFIVALLFFGEKIHVTNLAGLVLLIGGVLLITRA